MNILYLSCHATLEYDELLLFHELGYDFFSIGGYINPRTPHDPKRPAIDHDGHQHLADIAMVHNQYNLHEKQIAWADVVIIMHIPEWVENNWDLLKKSGKRVIWRSIGQSVNGVEQRIAPYFKEGLEIVRYSPYESRIPGYAGESAVIRFYKDPEEFGGWTGETDEVITFAQNMRGRGEFCNYETFLEISKGRNAKVYGPHNEDSGDLCGGLLGYEEMQEKMRKAGVYFYTGTWPASYTLNFIEAWMSGIPMVAIGPSKGNSKEFGQDTYEVADLLKNGRFGFASDDIDQMNIFIDKLLEDKTLARQISERAREEAIGLFGKEIVKKHWKTYLEGGQ
jgi:glycosyltransferase involved in cell wall biosynthesis